MFGPRQRPDLAIYTFATQMLAGTPIDVYGEGRVVRDYTYVDDAVNAIVRLAGSPEPRLVVNVGSHRPITNGEVVDALERELGVPAQRRLLPRQPGDAEGTFADIERARTSLGWAPVTPFEEGIARFADWLRADTVATTA